MAHSPFPSHIPALLPGKPLLAVFLVFLLPLSAQAAGASADRLKSETEKIAGLQEELAGVKVNLEFTDMRVKAARDSVRKLEDRIARQKDRISLIQGELEAVASQSAETCQAIEVAKEKLRGSEARYESTLNRFRARLIHLHKIRQGTLLDSVFNAKDLNSFLSRFQMVRYLLIHDRDLLEDLKRIRDEVNAQAETLRQKQVQLTELAADTQRKREDLLIESSSLSAMLQALVLEKKLLVARQEKLRKSLAELEGTISQVENLRAKDPKGFDQDLDAPPVKPVRQVLVTAPAPYSSAGTGNDMAPPPVKHLAPGMTTTQAVPVPTTGPAPAPFQSQNQTQAQVQPSVQPTTPGQNPPQVVSAAPAGPGPAGVGAYGDTSAAQRFQWPLKQFKLLNADKPEAKKNALELGTTEPADVLSMAAGKVMFNGPLADYGNVVILGHKNGFTTVYGRLQTIWVGLGQTIEVGEVIGQTLGAAAPLHVEIRLIGKSQDPLHFLPKR